MGTVSTFRQIGPGLAADGIPLVVDGRRTFARVAFPTRAVSAVSVLCESSPLLDLRSRSGIIGLSSGRRTERGRPRQKGRVPGQINQSAPAGSEKRLLVKPSLSP
jgi:hypothetical protein